MQAYDERGHRLMADMGSFTIYAAQMTEYGTPYSTINPITKAPVEKIGRYYELPAVLCTVDTR